MRRRTAILGLPALLSACANIKNVTDGTDTAANEGLLVLQISGTQKGNISFNPYGGSTFGSRFAENMIGPKGLVQFGPEEQVLVRSVEAGYYMWSKLTTGNQFAWVLSSTHLKVARSTITYVGHFRVSIVGNRFGVRVFDRENDAKAYLTENFPKYMAKLPFQKELAEVRIGA